MGRRELVGWRNAVFVLFFVSGLGLASWVSRIPTVRDDLALRTDQVGLLIFGLSAGSVLGLICAVWLLSALGARRALVAGVGRLIVDRRPGDIRIVDISLVPEARGAGVGSRLIGDLLEEARATDRIVSIHVEVHNRAAELYARLGFAVAEDLGVYRRMEWTG